MKLNEAYEIINNYIINETTVRITKGSNRARLGGSNAMRIFKRKNPGAFKKFQALKKKYFAMKLSIMKKYKSAGMREAKKSIK